jgi:hypothetical protein
MVCRVDPNKVVEYSQSERWRERVRTGLRLWLDQAGQQELTTAEQCEEFVGQLKVIFVPRPRPCSRTPAGPIAGCSSSTGRFIFVFEQLDVPLHKFPRVATLEELYEYVIEHEAANAFLRWLKIIEDGAIEVSARVVEWLRDERGRPHGAGNDYDWRVHGCPPGDRDYGILEYEEMWM